MEEFFIRQQIVQGIKASDSISNMAHICGGIIGSVIGYGLNENVKKPKKSGGTGYNIRY